MPEIAIIGGTGFYNPELLKNETQVTLKTPFGKHSDIVIGTFLGKEIAICFRHNRVHSIPPHKINFRANIWALKELGVKQAIIIAATGSLNKKFKPGNIVIADQFIDFGKFLTTIYNADEDYKPGEVYHLPLADPFCNELRQLLIKQAKTLKLQFKPTGTYLKISGPRFSTRAESKMYRQFADIIGMTAVPEIILCRELGICSALVAIVTDYDCWAERPVNIEEVKKNFTKSLGSLKKLLEAIIPTMPLKCKSGCQDSYKSAKA